jgi:hypothetical protein
VQAAIEHFLLQFEDTWYYDRLVWGFGSCPMLHPRVMTSWGPPVESSSERRAVRRLRSPQA